MLRALTLQWQAVGPLVEVDSLGVADICTTDPAMFGQGHFPRSDAESCEIARFIAAAPAMYALLTDWVTEGSAPPDAVAIVERFS
jgi:hypothetical protein